MFKVALFLLLEAFALQVFCEDAPALFAEVDQSVQNLPWGHYDYHGGPYPEHGYGYGYYPRRKYNIIYDTLTGLNSVSNFDGKVSSGNRNIQGIISDDGESSTSKSVAASRLAQTDVDNSVNALAVSRNYVDGVVPYPGKVFPRSFINWNYPFYAAYNPYFYPRAAVDSAPVNIVGSDGAVGVSS